MGLVRTKGYLITLISTLILQSCFCLPVNASALADCISATPSNGGGFAAHGAYFEVDFKSSCTDQNGSKLDLGSVHATLRAGGTYNTQAFYMTYGFEQVLFDTFATQPGNWAVQIDVTVDKDLSKSSINLGSFYNSGNQAATVTTPGVIGKKLCISAPGGQSQCTSAPYFDWEVCSLDPNGTLYLQRVSNWMKLWNISGKKDSGCSSKFPYLVKVQGTIQQSSGSSNLKVIFAKNGSNPGFTQLLTLKVE
jgi:hypothetical protein